MEINQLQTHIRHYGVLLVMSIHSWGCRSARYTALWTHIACSETVRDLLSSAFGLLLVVLLLPVLVVLLSIRRRTRAPWTLLLGSEGTVVGGVFLQ